MLICLSGILLPDWLEQKTGSICNEKMMQEIITCPEQKHFSPEMLTKLLHFIQGCQFAHWLWQSPSFFPKSNKNLQEKKFSVSSFLRLHLAKMWKIDMNFHLFVFPGKLLIWSAEERNSHGPQIWAGWTRAPSLRRGGQTSILPAQRTRRRLRTPRNQEENAVTQAVVCGQRLPRLLLRSQSDDFLDYFTAVVRHLCRRCDSHEPVVQQHVREYSVEIPVTTRTHHFHLHHWKIRSWRIWILQV